MGAGGADILLGVLVVVVIAVIVVMLLRHHGGGGSPSPGWSPGWSPGKSPGKSPDRSPSTRQGVLGIATDSMVDTVSRGKDVFNKDMVENFLQSGLSFWWNWNYTMSPAEKYLDGDQLRLLRATFVPMIWGVQQQVGLNAIEAKEIGEVFSRMQLYNEPDHFAPSPAGKTEVCAQKGWDDLSAGSYSAAMNCDSVAPGDATKGDGVVLDAAKTVASFLEARAGQPSEVWSPSLAGGPVGTDTAQCRAAVQWGPSSLGGIQYDVNTCSWPDCDFKTNKCLAMCQSWMDCFKAAAQKQPLPKMNGNLWDAIDVIQFHAYEYKASSVLARVDTMIKHFADDIKKGKRLALTEVAMAGVDGSTPWSQADITKVQSFMTELVQGIRSRSAVAYVSWFSKASFDSFVIGGLQPATKTWKSELFDETTGAPTEIGKHWFTLQFQR